MKRSSRVWSSRSSSAWPAARICFINRRSAVRRPASDAWFWGGVMAAFVVAAFAAPFASSHADGLEAVAERVGFAELAAEPKTLWLTDYAWPLAKGGDSATLWDGLAVSFAGLAGTAVVVAIACVCNRLFVPVPAPTGAGGSDRSGVGGGEHVA